MLSAAQVLRHLRAALALATGKKGEDDFREAVASPSPRNLHDVRSRLKPPGSIAEDIPLPDLRRLVAEWELEVAEWAKAVAVRQHTLDMRDRRADLLDALEFFAPTGNSKAEVLRAQLRAGARPNRAVPLKKGGVVVRVIDVVDGPPLSDDELADFAESEPDPRSVQRLLREAKKAPGGIRQLDRRLLR